MKTIIISYRGEDFTIAESVANKLCLKEGDIIINKEYHLRILRTNAIYYIGYRNTSLDLLLRQN